MPANFRELLAQPTDQVERPKPLAEGHYIGTIKAHEFGESKQKKTPFARFVITPSEETEDVPDGANDGIDLSKKELRKDYYLTPQSFYRLADMLDAVLGKQTGRTFDQRIPETRGARVVFQVTRRQSETDETEFFNDVGTIVGYAA